MSLQSELKRLFSPPVIRQSKRLKPDRVDALAVGEAAGALLRLKGKPTEQIALVRTMSPTTAAALCRWLADPAFWGLVSNVSHH
ncbi:hypothetical protein [Hydrogenophaga atypica]|uniref:Transposase n=1 Tax=Hydrogenophaga atypica TaxID=249409 RepID=A0ABW2QQI8_9BURK